MGIERRERRQKRAREFGTRHPWLTFVIVCAAMATAAVLGELAPS